MAAAAAGLCRCPTPGGGEPASADERFDLCIIGSGFAGTYLGLRAAAGGMRTVLVEAAPRTGRETLEDAFEITNSGETAYPANRTRLIAPGGTSNIWSGVINRLRPSDFRVQTEFGLEVDWPLEYTDLQAPYCEAEQALAVTGPAPVAGVEPPRSCAYPYQVAGSAGLPDFVLSDQPAQFFSVPQSKREGTGKAVRVAGDEIERFEATPGARLITGQQALNLVTTNGTTIDHLLTRTTDGAEQRIHARCFVVAAGVLESTRLLLLSRSRWHPEGLGNDRDLLGRFFVEHPTYLWRSEMRAPDGLPVGAFRSYALNDRFRSAGLNACHFQLHVLANGAVVWKAQPDMESRPESRVSLSTAGRDRFGTPLPDIRFGFSERDNRTTVELLRVLEPLTREFGASGPIRPTKIWRAHPAGTCRMGFDETNGVVDRDGLVFGTDNLFVSGASVFPSAGTSNPTLTIVALALRLGDQLLSRFGQG